MTLKTMVVVSLAFASVGCFGPTNTPADVTLGRARGEGISSTYEMPPDQAWTAAREILRDSSPKAVEEQRPQSFMLATYPVRFGVSRGQAYFGVWLEPADAGKTRVTAVLKTQVQNDPLKPITEEQFHFRMNERASKAKTAPAPAP